MFNSPRFKRQLLEVTERTIVVCDNPDCNYEVPAEASERTLAEKIKDLSFYLNKPCLICGDNLLTEKDFKTYITVQRFVAWLNKYFSWITWFYSDKSWAKRNTICVHTHEGITIEDAPVKH